MASRAAGSPLFPYTTLFRSRLRAEIERIVGQLETEVLIVGRRRQLEVGVLPLAPPSRDEDFSLDRKSTRLNSSHVEISYAVFCLKKKKNKAVDSEHLYKHSR